MKAQLTYVCVIVFKARDVPGRQDGGPWFRGNETRAKMQTWIETKEAVLKENKEISEQAGS